MKHIVKGKVHVYMPKIIVGIDTSGSMSDDTLSLGFSEIENLQRQYNGDVVVVECDAMIQKTYTLSKYTKPQRSVKGRGGTAFEPLFEFCNKEGCDILIFFTDLYGSFPSKVPPYRVIYLVDKKSGYGKAPFGRILEVCDAE